MNPINIDEALERDENVQAGLEEYKKMMSGIITQKTENRWLGIGSKKRVFGIILIPKER